MKKIFTPDERLKAANSCREHRTKNRLSQNAMATEMGIPPSYISNLENGYRDAPDWLVERFLATHEDAI